MMMRRRGYISFLVAALFVALSAMSCIFEYDSPGGGKEPDRNAELIMRLHTPKGFSTPATRSLTFEGENTLAEILVLVFDRTNTLTAIKQGDELKSYPEATGTGYTGTGAFSIKLKPSLDADDKYNLVVFANSRSIIEARIGLDADAVQNKSYAAVRAALWDGISGPMYTSGGAIPMWGESGPIEVKQYADEVNVSLRRAVARIDVGVGRPFYDAGTHAYTWDGKDNNDTPIPFELKHVWVISPNDRYALIPDPGKDAATTPTVPDDTDAFDLADSKAGFVFGSEGASGGKGGWMSRSIYVPEADVLIAPGAKPGKDDPNHLNRMALVVGGHFDGSPQETFYRLDFAEGGELMNVLRNTLYQFNISRVSGGGWSSVEQAYGETAMNMTVEVLNWNGEIFEDVRIKGDQSFSISRKSPMTMSAARGETETLTFETNIGGFTMTLSSPSRTLSSAAADAAPATGAQVSTGWFDYTLRKVTGASQPGHTRYTLDITTRSMNFGSGTSAQDARLDAWAVDADGIMGFTYEVAQQWSATDPTPRVVGLSVSPPAGEGSVAGGTIVATHETAAEGARVRVAAIPAPGWAFVRWEAKKGLTIIPAEETNPELTFPMPAEEVSLTAHFEFIPLQYAVTVVNPTPPMLITGEAVASAQTAKAGQTVHILASPAVGYEFSEWEVISGGTGEAMTLEGLVKGDNPAVFIMPAGDVSLRALFTVSDVRGQYTVRAEVNPSGAGTAVSSRATANETQTARLMAIPADGRAFSHWEISGTGATIDKAKDNPATLTVGTGNVVATAYFIAENTIAVTSSDEDWGTAVASPARTITGKQVTLTAIPKAGFLFDRWEVEAGGVEITNPGANPATFEMNSQPVAIKAHFKKQNQPLAVIANNSDWGGIDIDPANPTEGQTVMLTPRAETGYRFKGWAVLNKGNAASLVVENNPATFRMPSGLVSIRADFEPLPRTITVVKATGGTATAEAIGGTATSTATDNGVTNLAVAGERVSVAATPGEGYIFKRWTFENAVPVSTTTNPTTFIMPAGNVTITPTFALAPIVTLAPETMLAPTVNTAQQIAVTSNVAWSANLTSGGGDFTIGDNIGRPAGTSYFTITPKSRNTTATDRKAVIEINADGVIHQAAVIHSAASLSIEPASLFAWAAGDTAPQTIDVAANIPWTATSGTQANFVVSEIGTGSFKVAPAGENKTIGPLTATITVSGTGDFSGTTRTLELTQSAAGASIAITDLAAATAPFASTATVARTVGVTANIPWTVSVSPETYFIVENAANSTTQFTVRPRNTANVMERRAEVTVRGVGGNAGISTSFTVTQSAAAGIYAAPGMPGIRQSDLERLQAARNQSGNPGLLLRDINMTMNGSSTYAGTYVEQIAIRELGGLETEPVYTLYFKWGSTVAMVGGVGDTWSVDDVVWVNPEFTGTITTSLGSSPHFLYGGFTQALYSGSAPIVDRPAGHADPCDYAGGATATNPSGWKTPVGNPWQSLQPYSGTTRPFGQWFDYAIWATARSSHGTKMYWRASNGTVPSGLDNPTVETGNSPHGAAVSDDKDLFLPAAGYRNQDGNMADSGAGGRYLTSTAYQTSQYIGTRFDSSEVHAAHTDVYYYGSALRCVAAAPYLISDKSEVTFAPTASSIMNQQTVSVSSNGRWSATLESGDEFFTISMTSGIGNGSIKIYPKAANTTIVDRTAVLKLTASGVDPQTVTITQTQAPARISASPTTLAWLNSKNAQNITVTSNVPWKATLAEGGEAKFTPTGTLSGSPAPTDGNTQYTFTITPTDINLTSEEIKVSMVLENTGTEGASPVNISFTQLAAKFIGDILYFGKNEYGETILKLGTWNQEITPDNYRTSAAYFKGGSVIGFTASESFPASMRFNPMTDPSLITGWGTTETTDESNILPNIPGYVTADNNFRNGSGQYTKRNMSHPDYHNIANIKAEGKGDPCQILGLTEAQLRGATDDAAYAALIAARNTAYPEYAGWRLPTLADARIWAGTNSSSLSRGNGYTYIGSPFIYGVLGLGSEPTSIWPILGVLQPTLTRTNMGAWPTSAANQDYTWRTVTILGMRWEDMWMAGWHIGSVTTARTVRCVQDQ